MVSGAMVAVMYRDINPLVRATGIPIRQAIRQESMRLEDIEWETGVRPSDVWLKFLQAEAERGVTRFYNGVELIDGQNSLR